MRPDQQRGERAVLAGDDAGKVGEADPVPPVRQGERGAAVGAAADLGQAEGNVALGGGMAGSADDPALGAAEFVGGAFEECGKR